MNNKFKEILNSKVFLSGISFVTLVSLLFNLILLLQVLELDSDLSLTESEGMPSEKIEEYQLAISSLERKNKKLEEELKVLFQEDGDVENKEDTKGEKKTSVVIDKNINKRAELINFVSEFTELFLTRGNEEDLKRRNQLEPYLERNVLDLFAPEGEDGLLSFEVEHGDTEDILGENHEYNVKVAKQSVYINDESLDSEEINVFVLASTETTLNGSSPSNDKVTLDIRIENKEGMLKIKDVYLGSLD